MARSVNKVILVGNVGKEPDIRYTASGAPIATFSLATGRNRQDANGNWVEETDWHRVVCWERQAEFVMNYVGKGRKLYVEGRLQTRKWTDQNGVERYTTEVVAREVIALDKQSDSEGDDWEDEAPQRPAPTQQPARQPATTGTRGRPRREVDQSETFGTDLELDDVPF